MLTGVISEADCSVLGRKKQGLFMYGGQVGGAGPNRNLNFLIIIVSEGRDATTHLSLNRSAPEFVLCLVRVAWLSSAPPFLG